MPFDGTNWKEESLPEKPVRPRPTLLILATNVSLCVATSLLAGKILEIGAQLPQSLELNTCATPKGLAVSQSNLFIKICDRIGNSNERSIIGNFTR